MSWDVPETNLGRSPRKVPGTANGDALDQSLVFDPVATDLLPYQVEEDARLSQGRGQRSLIYLTLSCILLLCTIGVESKSEA